MSYLTQNAISESPTMRNRVAQCVATEHLSDDPDGWMYDRRRTWAAAPGWDAAWESALANDPNQDPGANSAVISDGMILAQVQGMV